MKYLDLFEKSSSPCKASQIALGCDHYGETISEEQAFRAMDAFYEQGGTLLDTAHVYGQAAIGMLSTSEAIVGKWIANNGLSGKVVVSDKGAHPDRSNMSASRISQQEIQEDLFFSLETLKLNSVDIWFLHRDDPRIPVGEIIDMLSSYVDKGYIKHLGASNWTVKRLCEAQQYACSNGKRGFEISQIQWSLAISTPAAWNDPTLVCMNDEQQGWYEEHQFPVMAFSPQARGLFSKVIEQGESAVSEKTANQFLLSQNRRRIENCRKLCLRESVSPAGICLSYLTSAPFPTIPVIGCSNTTQLLGSLEQINLQLSQADRAFLTAKD